MALDTAQKRGSAMCLKSPWRRWLSEPHGTDLDYGDRLSVLHMCSAAGDALQEPTVIGVGYQVPDGRPHYRIGDTRPYYRVIE